MRNGTGNLNGGPPAITPSNPPDINTKHQYQDTARAALYNKLWAVMKECPYIQKDRTVDFGRKYNYASEAAIKEKLHEALVRNRLLFLPSISDHSERIIAGKVENGRESAPAALTILRVHFKFVDVDSGESEEGEFFATGIDAQDKGTYKAITGAIKYILTSWFLIATGDDPEQQADEPAPPAERTPPKITAGTAGGSVRPPWKSMQEMREYFAKIRERVGEVIYNDELGKSGVTNFAEFRSAKVATDCYNRLYAIATKSKGAA